jgi:hypothetical protein
MPYTLSPKLPKGGPPFAPIALVILLLPIVMSMKKS